MNLTEATVLEAVSNLIDTNTNKSYVASKSIKNICVTDDNLSLEVILAYPAQTQFDSISQQFKTALQPLAGNRKININVATKISAHQVQRGIELLPGVKNLIAVASGKGGVGKSTTAANLALALASEGARVGILDADIYGPSQPLLMGLAGQHPDSFDGKSMRPLIAHGIQTMSIGYLIDDDQAMIWRGPMASQALQQLFNDTKWDDLDYLIVDMPPGTGDVPLTLAQKIPVTGVLIVTTPQDIALLDARKGIKMFQKVNVPILGLVENMSTHICSNCGHAEAIFGQDGAKSIERDFNVNLLGSLPLEMGIRLAADNGMPTVISEPNSPSTAIYQSIARKLAAKVAEKPRGFSTKLPKIVVQNS